MKSSHSFSRYFNNVLRLQKRYGFYTSLRTVMHYALRFVNKLKNDLSKEHIVKVNGYKLKTIPNDVGISSELLAFHVHEPLSTSVMSNIIKQGMTCLDVGSNIGYYVMLEHKLVGDKGKIIAIEPSPKNYRYLLDNVKLQNAINIECYNFAVGNKNGVTKFFIDKRSNGCWTITDDQIPTGPGEIIEVPIKRLDDFVDEIKLNKIDLVRMDVEGHEKYIFEGMDKILKNHHPSIQIEVHASSMGIEDTIKLLQKLKNYGYEILYFIPREVDLPVIGYKNHIRKYSISKVIELLKHKSIAYFFTLILTYNQEKVE